MIAKARVCSVPGCPEIAPAGGKCPRHRRDAARAADAKRPSATARGYGERWRRTRARFLRDHPWCTWPDGCGQPATEAHHIDGLGPLGPRGHDDTNLQALCKRHHAHISAREQPGGWAA